MIVIMVGNNKGGVGKSTTTVNLAVEFSSVYKKRVLVLDADINGNCTSGLGIEKYTLERGVTSLMNGRLVKDCIVRSKYGVDVIGNSVKFESEVGSFAGDYVSGCKKLLGGVERIRKYCKYDVVLVDTPPGFGIMLYNCLYACDTVLIPLLAEPYAVEGMGRMQESVETCGKGILGVFFTMVSDRYKLTKELYADVVKVLGKGVSFFDSHVPRSIKVADLQYDNVPIVVGALKNPVCVAYKKLCGEIYEKIKSHG